MSAGCAGEHVDAGQAVSAVVRRIVADAAEHGGETPRRRAQCHDPVHCEFAGKRECLAAAVGGSNGFGGKLRFQPGMDAGREWRGQADAGSGGRRVSADVRAGAAGSAWDEDRVAKRGKWRSGVVDRLATLAEN